MDTDIAATTAPSRPWTGTATQRRFPYLSPGDVMELSIDKLGTRKQVLGKA